MIKEPKTKQYSLTVIIPCYNKEKYVKECIESVLEQTLLPEKIIIVDDCSTDNSRKIINEICNTNEIIKKIYLEKNQGVSHARNVGLKNAETEYVTFLDADDFYGNINKLYNEMQVIMKHSENIIAYSKISFSDESGKIQEKRIYPNDVYLNGNIYRKLLIGNFSFEVIARDYCVRKEDVLAVGGYNECRALYEDLELLIKLSKNIKFYCTNETGTVYRNVGNGLSNQTEKRNREVRNEIFYENMESMRGIRKFYLYIYWHINYLFRYIILGKIFYFFVDILKDFKRIVKKVKEEI